MGNPRSGKGKYRDSVNAFGQATDTDPEFTNAWFNKSLALVNPKSGEEPILIPVISQLRVPENQVFFILQVPSLKTLSSSG